MRVHTARLMIQITLVGVGLMIGSFRARAQSQSVSAGSLGTQILRNFQGLSPTTTGHVASASATWSIYTPAKSGVLQLDTAGTPADTTLCVYTGPSLFALTEVAYNDDAAQGTKTSLLKLSVTAGTSYRMAVDQKPAGAGKVVVLNRAFLEAENVPAVYSGTITIPGAALAAAAADAPKPAGVACEFMTWQKLHAQRDGTLTASTAGSAIDTVLALYSGTESAAFKDLVPVASNDNADGKNTSKVSAPVKTGTWLFLQVGGKGKTRGNVIIDYTLSDPTK